MAEINEGAETVKEPFAPKKEAEARVEKPEQKKEVVKVVEPPKPWQPTLTLKNKFDSPTAQVGVSCEVISTRDGLGLIVDRSKKINTRMITIQALKQLPCFHARKYSLWSKFVVSEEDKAKLMDMTLNEIAAKERTGNW